jgi:hypothetical protein
MDGIWSFGGTLVVSKYSNSMKPLLQTLKSEDTVGILQYNPQKFDQSDFAK